MANNRLTKTGTPRKRAPSGGRKGEYHERQARTTVTLPASHTDKLRAYGSSYVSKGIRRLAEERWPELAE